jgi:CRISPR/Cas system CSM-associated protein Csm2 small subunit
MPSSNQSVALISILFFLFACQVEIKKTETSSTQKTTETKVKSLNPNGDSELALMMRSMYEEADRIKKQIADGEAVEIKLDHGKILTAHATEPEKAASAEYKGFAKVYLSHLEKLENAQGEEAEKHFKTLVDNCLSCHQALCPGPMVRIKKLKRSV